MFTKETCMTIIDQHAQLTAELKRILCIMNSLAKSIIDFDLIDDTFRVSYEECYQSMWSKNKAYIPFELLGATDDVIRSFVRMKHMEQYGKALRELKP